MKKIFLPIFLLFILLLAGCDSSAKKEVVPYIKVENNELDKSIFKESSDGIPVSLTVLNMTDLDIGMFSLIDPKANEAIQIAPIDSQKYINMDINWPNNENEIRWALYNKDGGLCIEGKSDVTGVKESITIAFSGEGNVTDIKVQVN